jgi:enamine deaminase RidA (YjgF/YER057c/UK114 family)
MEKIVELTSLKLSSPATMHKPLGYSHVAEVTRGKLIHIAGQVALDGAGNLAGKADFGAQVRQVFANLGAALESAGAGFHNVIKLNYYCVDTVDLAAGLPVMRTIRDGFINTAAPPASTFVVVRRLVHPDWLIEVEAVAVV